MNRKLKYALPERTHDTMSEAIALSSPSGKMSERKSHAASEKLRVALFGEQGLHYETVQPSEEETLGRRIADLEAIIARGMKPRGYKKTLASWKIRLAEINS